MATSKSTTLSFWIEPELKEALRTAAQQERCSIANMVAVLIRDHCKRNGIELQKLQGKTTNDTSR